MNDNKPTTEKICFAIQDLIKKEQDKSSPDRDKLSGLYNKLYNTLLPYAINLSKLYKLGYVIKTQGGIKFNRSTFGAFSGSDHRRDMCSEAVTLLLASMYGVKKNNKVKPPSYIELSFAGTLKLKFKEVMYDPKSFGSTAKFNVSSLEAKMFSDEENLDKYKVDNFEGKYLSTENNALENNISEEMARHLLDKINNNESSSYLEISQRHVTDLLRLVCIEKMTKGDEKSILGILEKYPRLKPQFFSSVFSMYSTIKEF